MVTFFVLAAAAISSGWESVKGAFRDSPTASVIETEAPQSDRWVFLRGGAQVDMGDQPRPQVMVRLSSHGDAGPVRILYVRREK